MALDLTFLESDVRAAASDVPSTLTYGAQTIACVASPIRKTSDVQEIGEFAGYDLEASFAVADLSALPAVRDTLTVDGVSYFVEQVDRDAQVCRVTLRRRE